MSEVYMGQIQAFAFPYAPRNWAQCNGQLLPIAQNQALFALLGTTYGGNGQTTFALPDLRGRFAVHAGQGIVQGQAAGEASHALTVPEMPVHRHGVVARTTATLSEPVGAYLASPGKQAFGQSPSTTLHPQTLAATGGSQPHENRPPFTVLNYCIALVGIFPSRN